MVGQTVQAKNAKKNLVKSSSALIAEAPTVPEDHCYHLALYHCYSHKGTQIPSKMSVYHNNLGKRYEKELKLTFDQCTAVAHWYAP